MINCFLGLLFNAGNSLNYVGRDPANDRMGRYIFRHDCPGSNHRPFSDMNAVSNYRS